MIYMLTCSKNTGDFKLIKSYIDMYCKDIDYTYLSFEYPMDLLDYLNAARPPKCMLFFATDNYEEGIEISNKVNELNPRYRFILLCDHYDDVEDLFCNGVAYFIKTPCEAEPMKRCLDFTKRFFEEQLGRSIRLKSRNETELIILSDIEYIMSDKRKIVIKTKSTERNYYYKLDEIERMLGDGFLRCHQSYIVNMTRIKQFVMDGIMLLDDTFIPASRKRYYASKREYLSYVTGRKGL